MNPLEKLAGLFARFPGIGLRQSKRFAYFIAEQNDSYINELVESIALTRTSMSRCASCRRLAVIHDNATHCGICTDKSRDRTLLLVTEKDSDLEAIERAANYRGYYFVLGGLLAEDDKKSFARIPECLATITRRAREGLVEVIVAFSAKPESDYTFFKLKEKIRLLPESKILGISRLGRGMSTGTEIEYSDSDTLINALANRK